MASLSRTLDCLDAAYRLDLDDDAYVRNLALGIWSLSIAGCDQARDDPSVRSPADSSSVDKGARAGWGQSRRRRCSGRFDSPGADAACTGVTDIFINRLDKVGSTLTSSSRRP
jgi:hypothetical protein